MLTVISRFAVMAGLGMLLYWIADAGGPSEIAKSNAAHYRCEDLGPKLRVSTFTVD
jgi:hypothetical protein